jgi:hypothetical protein
MAKAQTETFQIDIIPTLDTSAYASGDAMDVKQEISFAGQLQDPVKSGIIASIAIIDTAQQSAAFDMEFFDQSIADQTDNVACNVSAADALKWLGRVSVTAADYKDIGAAHCAVKNIADTGFHINFPDAYSSLYMQLICRDAPTYLASSLKIRISILMD